MTYKITQLFVNSAQYIRRVGFNQNRIIQVLIPFQEYKDWA